MDFLHASNEHIQSRKPLDMITAAGDFSSEVKLNMLAMDEELGVKRSY